MRTYDRRTRRGFTLVELLTVIAIIALLIGLLVPAVGAARNHAKKVATKSLHSALGKGCEMFRVDFDRYPNSGGPERMNGNPFEPQFPEIPLSGAQWLILELAGADLKGYVRKTDGGDFDADRDGDFGDPDDWACYYRPTPCDPDFIPPRKGPYIELEGLTARTPELYAEEAGLILPDELDPDGAAGTSDFNNGRLPMAVDAFGFPVLYYAANEHAVHPFADLSAAAADQKIGCYSSRDNAQFTGSDQPGYNFDGFDLGAGPLSDGHFHNLYDLGWQVGSVAEPLPNTFASFLYDEDMYAQQQVGGAGRAWPHKPKTFLFISSGPDAVYGTVDDVTDF